MKHFETGDWIDFARNACTPTRRASLESHLETGCSECQRAAEFFGKFARITKAMSSESVPAAMVRQAEAIYPSRRPSSWKRALRVPAALVYDSFRAPLPAGLRSTWQMGWQAMFRAGDCSLDLRIEPDLRSSRATLTGQVSNHLLPNLQMGDIPVSLRSGRRTVAETTSNLFGEFQLEYDQASRLELCIDLEGGCKRIVAPLRRITPDGAAGSEAPTHSRRKRAARLS
jgi:hypothetical protein